MKKQWLLVALSIGLTGCAGCTRVGPGYVGVKINMAGSSKGVADIPATTGWTTYNIFTEEVLEYPTFVQTAVWTQNTAEGKPVNEEITFTTKDSMQVAADISLAYSLQADHVPHFYVKFRSDDLEKFTHGFLRNLAREKFDMAAGHYSIDQVMGDNAAFLGEARGALQKELDPIGVKLEQFGFIGAPRPPQGVINSINLKVQASQLAMQKQNEIVQAEADAKKRIAEAQGIAQSVLVQAEAQATANRKLAESITPNYVEYLKAQKWNGQLPQVTSGAGVLMSLPARGAGQ